MAKGNLHSEEELLLLLKQDDLSAFDELYWKYQKAVYQNALKLLKDPVVAEDLVQEVFISLWERRLSIDTERSVGGWLFVTSYNRSINILKKNLRESLALKELSITDNAAEVDEEIHGIRLGVLEKAISELSPQKRKVFELCKLQGKTYEEAAQELNISKHTVKEYLSASIVYIKEYARNHPDIGLSLLILVNTF